MNNSFAHAVGAAAITLALVHPVAAQVSLQTTPPPTVTAENEPWYSSGGPVTFAGGVYYPAGAVTHFLRNEMVRTGTVGNVPIYARTTQEAGSVIYVPLAGGVMKPYERRRSGDLAGTVGSSAPSFTVVLPSEEALPDRRQRPAGALSLLLSRFLSAQPASSRRRPLPAPHRRRTGARRRARAGRHERGRVRRAVAPGANADSDRAAARRPQPVFVDFQNARWFAAGTTVEYTPSRFTRIGEHRGFDVYQESGRPGTIYLSLLDGAPGLLAPYKSR